MNGIRESKAAIAQQIVVTRDDSIAADGRVADAFREIAPDTFSERALRCGGDHEALGCCREMRRKPAMRLGPSFRRQRVANAAQLRQRRKQPMEIAAIPLRRSDASTRAIDCDAGRSGGAPGELSTIHPCEARKHSHGASSPPRRTRRTRRIWF